MKQDDHDDFGGLTRDLQTMSRRGMFKWLATAALVPLAGCLDRGVGSTDESDAGTTTTTTATCEEIPTETAGPYPGDGTNGANALALSGIVRSDLRTSIGTASGTATGIELEMTITLVSADTCEPLVGYAIYLWHCTQGGAYSMYSGAAQAENYLRGVQVTDENGQVTFTTIFPGCYSGRWPHIHFEVFSSLASATSGTNKVAVSQIAMPKATCDVVYATSGYSASVSNLAQTSLSSDNVFGDGSALQVATIEGSVSSFFAGSLTVAIATS